jgi:hypothetical protein
VPCQLRERVTNGKSHHTIFLEKEREEKAVFDW